MNRIINDKKGDYRLYQHTENEDEVVLFVEYGESHDGMRFIVHHGSIIVSKNGATEYPEIQMLVDEKIKGFENGSVLD